MTRLVALDLAGGPGFATAVRRAWDSGDAIAVVDRRLAPAARDAQLAALDPDTIIDPRGARARTGTRWAPPLANDDAVVVTTSGTTGVPRALVFTHAALAAHATAVHERLEANPATDRWLACLPLAHLGGLGVVLRSLIGGVGVDVIDGFDAATVDGAPDRLGSTLVSLVPTALDRVDEARWRRVVLGGGADARQRPANVIGTYGLTETGGGVVYDGRPLSGTEVRADEAGELWLRGPTMARAQRDGASLTDPEGWLGTGDLGVVGGDGAVRVHGRRDEMIVTGGENVWPDALEAVLATDPRVAEVAVSGRPDDEWGQRVVAWVVSVDAAEPPRLDDLRSRVRDEVAGFAAPRELELVTELPRTALGKIRRRELI